MVRKMPYLRWNLWKFYQIASKPKKCKNKYVCICWFGRERKKNFVLFLKICKVSHTYTYECTSTNERLYAYVYHMHKHIYKPDQKIVLYVCMCVPACCTLPNGIIAASQNKEMHTYKQTNTDYDTLIHRIPLVCIEHTACMNVCENCIANLPMYRMKRIVTS